MKALLNFNQVVFINHQKIIIAKTSRREIAISHDCFELNGSQELLSFTLHTTFYFNACHAILMESLPV